MNRVEVRIVEVSVYVLLYHQRDKFRNTCLLIQLLAVGFLSDERWHINIIIYVQSDLRTVSQRR